MKHVIRNFRAISPVLAVLMMIAVAIAGSLVVYAWVMGYIGVSTDKSGEAITIQNVFNDGDDLLVYVQNVGEIVVQFDEDECLYVNGILVPCTISGVTVSDGMATLAPGKTATLRYTGGAPLPGEKTAIKVTTSRGTPAEKYAYPSGTAQAPAGSILWNQAYGGASNDVAQSVVTTSDGGYAIVGHTESFGAGAINAWLVKTDASGNMQWNKTYGETDQGMVSALVATSDGGYAIAGQTWSFGAGFWDFWLVKTDSLGNEEWSQKYGGTGDDRAYSLIEMSEGGYALAGWTSSLGAGDFDVWLVKTDASGNEEWNRTYGGTEQDWAYSVVETVDGKYAIAGKTSSFGAGAYDFWLIKTDSLGNEEWNRTYGGPTDEEAHSLVVTSDGGYAIAGHTESFGAGNTDFWLVKTDEYGNEEWSQTYGGTENDEASSLVRTSDGGYVIAGWTGPIAAEDFWLVKTDSDGNEEWSQTYGGAGREEAQSLVATSDGGYALAGETGTYGAGNMDFWLVKTN